MSFHKFTDKHKKWDAMWFALDENFFTDEYDGSQMFKNQYKVKITRRLDQEAMDTKQELHRQIYLHKLNGISSDIVNLPEISPSRWDHLRKELDSTNAFFFRKLSSDCYEFTRTSEYCTYRHHRILKKSIIKRYPLLERFQTPFYDIIQVFNRQGRLLYYLAQNSRPFIIPHKASAKSPFGNAEYSPDHTLDSNVLNYFVISLFSEAIIKITSNDLITGCIIIVEIGKFRVGRIHLNPFGELLIMCETVHPGKLTHDYIVKCKQSSQCKYHEFFVYEVTTMNTIATITCKIWKILEHQNMNDIVDPRMFGLCFKENVTIIDKTLIFGAAIIIVHEYYRVLWSGSLQKRATCCTGAVKKPHLLTENDFKYTLPKTPSIGLLNKNDLK